MEYYSKIRHSSLDEHQNNDDEKRAHTVLNLCKTLENTGKSGVTERSTVTLGWGERNGDFVRRRRVQGSFRRVSVFNTLIIAVVSSYVKSH